MTGGICVITHDGLPSVIPRSPKTTVHLETAR
nr:MAG TPA: hypothetical protein [Caudoviricetes sp.]